MFSFSGASRGRIAAAALLVTLSLVACSKKGRQPAPTPGGTGNTGAARATLIKNVTMDAKITQTAANAGVTGGICAQLVKPSSGTNSGKHVLEISSAPCPATGVADPAKGTVSVLTFGALDSTYDERYLYVFESTSWQYGAVYGANPGTNPKQYVIDKLVFLCNTDSSDATPAAVPYSDNCNFAASTNGKFEGLELVED